MVTKETILTAEGLKKLEAELEELLTVRRPQVAARLKAAIALGDLSENSEYEDAKNEQAFMEGRIQTLENMIKTATVIDMSNSGDTVNIGSTIVVRDESEGEEEEYTIVGTTEADPLANRISNESPLGIAVIGQKVGSTVVVSAPAGDFTYKILAIK